MLILTNLWSTTSCTTTFSSFPPIIAIGNYLTHTRKWGKLCFTTDARSKFTEKFSLVLALNFPESGELWLRVVSVSLWICFFRNNNFCEIEKYKNSAQFLRKFMGKVLLFFPVLFNMYIIVIESSKLCSLLTNNVKI